MHYWGKPDPTPVLELVIREVLTGMSLVDIVVVAKAISKKLQEDDWIRTSQERQYYEAPRFDQNPPPTPTMSTTIEVDGVVSKTW